MKKLLNNLLDKIATQFKNDASKMLIRTGVIGWALSSAAQIGAILVNDKIPDEQKGFLVPQELADAVVNIMLFFCITQSTKKIVSKMFQTGKFAPKSVREFLNKHKDLYGDKVGKYDFSLDNVKDKHSDFPFDQYWTTKNLGTTMATVTAGVVSSNIITPVVRNYWASKAQKKYIDYKNNYPYQTTSSNMKI